MQDLCLSFTDEAESLPILYTIKQEPIYNQVPIKGKFTTEYTYTFINPSTGQTEEWWSEKLMTELNSDDNASFEEDEVAPLTLIKTEEVQATEYVEIATKDVYVANYQNISVIGIVYQRPPIPTPPDYEPVPYPAPNYGVNVLLLDGEDIEPLRPFICNPKKPVRVWAV